MRKKKHKTSEERNADAREIWLDDNTLNEISSDTSGSDDHTMKLLRIMRMISYTARKTPVPVN